MSCKLIDEQDIVHIIEDNKKLIKIKIHAANFDQKPVYINGNLQIATSEKTMEILK